MHYYFIVIINYFNSCVEGIHSDPKPDVCSNLI
jgi:hypothetical protein